MIEVFEVQGEAWYIQAYLDKIDKANRKAKRAGLPAGFSATITDTVKVTRERGGIKFDVEEQVLEISGDSQSKPGWSFAATVDWSNEGGQPVLHTLPTYDGPTLPRPTSKVCEHCNTVRSRKETFLVVGPDRQVKQVGRQCLTAFTGIPLGWVSLAQGVAKSDDDYWSSGFKVDPSFDLRSTLRLAISLTDALGFVSRNAAEQRGVRSTRDEFALLWYGPPKGDTVWEREERAHFDWLVETLAKRTRTDEEVTEEIDKIIAWGATLDTADSDYLQNLHAVLGAERIGRRSLGYTISAPASWRRTVQREAKRAEAKAKRTEVVEGRRVITGTVKRLRTDDYGYGPTLKALVETDAGEVLWGSVPAAIDEVMEGQRVTFTATVAQKQGDPTFGLWKRPTKASIL